MFKKVETLSRSEKLQGKFYCIHEKDKNILKNVCSLCDFSSLYMSIAGFFYLGILGEASLIMPNRKGRREKNYERAVLAEQTV